MFVANRKAIASGRFAYLMALYAENYWRLVGLFGPDRLVRGEYLSSVGDGIDLRVSMLERQPYTLDLCLSYLFEDDATGRPDPSAHVRVYRDARVAEVTTWGVKTARDVRFVPTGTPRLLPTTMGGRLIVGTVLVSSIVTVASMVASDESIAAR